jgi:hypothetical protein
MLNEVVFERVKLPATTKFNRIEDPKTAPILCYLKQKLYSQHK